MNKNHYLFIVSILVLLVFFSLKTQIFETFRGGIGGFGGGRGLGFGRGGGYYGNPRGLYGRRGIYPRRRQFYSYGAYPVYNSVPVAVPVPVVNQVEYPWYRRWFGIGGDCKSGCTNIGKGRWGCQYPGNGINECQFSDDCQWC